MNVIEPDAYVVVITGYLDCQLHYQGFKARVIADDGAGYLVRDLEGREYHCHARELLLDTAPDTNPH